MLAVPTSALSPDEADRHEELRGIFRAEGIDFEELAGTDGIATVLTVTIPAAEADERSPGVFILAIPLAHAEMPEPADGTGTAGISGDGGLPDGSLPFDIDTGIRFMRKMRARGGGRKIVTAFLLPGETALSLKTLYGAFVTTTILDTAAILENNENTLLVYLDVTEGAGEIGIYHGTRGTVAPLSLVRPVPALLAAHGISRKWFCLFPVTSRGFV
ncbi:hypothetical protein FACS189493_7640 [Spirochaetia bacterium]|nr:hypothetical protein FACS189493_7640 [Spirochaetia bacterium]